jgi:hypothetical protein
MKFINPKVHAYLDYAYVLALAAAPTLFNFVGTAATLSYALAVTVLLLALFTRYPLGVVKAIPFPIHGMIELVASLVVIGSPWLLGFSEIDVARNFFLAAGILLFGVWAFTDYKQTLPVEERQPEGAKPAGA